MLKQLRRKFVLIVMTLVGTVLVAVLGSTYLAIWQTQRTLTNESLKHCLYGEDTGRPTIGARPRGGRLEGMMVSLLVHVSDEGIVLEVGDSPVVVNAQALAEVIDSVLDEGALEGSDKSLHLAWKSAALEDGSWNIAIVDTSNSDTVLHRQAIRDLQIIALALVALFAISWWLSDWALRPVDAAWKQQRRFVADASHELKTPLAVILANTQILQRDETLGTDARRWVDSTAEEAGHMKSLVGDLLQLARADETAAGLTEGVMQREDVDLTEIVEAAALEFDAVAFERGCVLEERVAENVHMTGDPDWLERLVRILIDNACKYAEEGTTIDVALSLASGKPQLAVHNWGNPIDAEDLPHVFERFYRSDKARKRAAEGGFGLGLAIAKGIAETHGGSISAKSSTEEGTTFTVSFG